MKKQLVDNDVESDTPGKWCWTFWLEEHCWLQSHLQKLLGPIELSSNERLCKNASGCRLTEGLRQTK
jgi:hypothetical protein